MAVVSFSLTFFGFSFFVFGYDVIPVVNGATIVGKTAFIGIPPAPRVFNVNKEPEVCGKVRSLEKIQVKNGLLKGVVIVLEGVKNGKAFETKAFKAKLPGEASFNMNPGEFLILMCHKRNVTLGQ